MVVLAKQSTDLWSQFRERVRVHIEEVILELGSNRCSVDMEDELITVGHFERHLISDFDRVGGRFHSNASEQYFDLILRGTRMDLVDISELFKAKRILVLRSTNKTTTMTRKHKYMNKY